MKCCMSTICFFTLVYYCMGKTTESHSLLDDKDTTTLDSLFNDRSQVDDNNSTSSTSQVGDRAGQSRMLSLQKLFTSTTTVKPTAYDYWSFFTTPRRPLISYRDYPGKPGVASWKEISATAVKDNRKDRKIADPTAAGVSSEAHRWRCTSCWFAILLGAVIARLGIYL